MKIMKNKLSFNGKGGNKIPPSTIAFVILIILFVVFLIACIYFYSKVQDDRKKLTAEKDKINMYFEIQKKDKQNSNETSDVKDDTYSKANYNITYDGIIEIPSINLQKGFYNLGNKNNTVKRGLEVISGSEMPDKENSTLVIAGHSGSGYLAMFNKLDKVNQNDSIYIYYNGIKYTYKMEKSEIVAKTGKISVNLDSNKQWLILTTCNPSNRYKEQLVLTCVLTSKEAM